MRILHRCMQHSTGLRASFSALAASTCCHDLSFYNSVFDNGARCCYSAAYLE